jgi:hypothetical protein
MHIRSVWPGELDGDDDPFDPDAPKLTGRAALLHKIRRLSGDIWECGPGDNWECPEWLSGGEQDPEIARELSRLPPSKVKQHLIAEAEQLMRQHRAHGLTRSRPPVIRRRACGARQRPRARARRSNPHRTNAPPAGGDDSPDGEGERHPVGLPLAGSSARRLVDSMARVGVVVI